MSSFTDAKDSVDQGRLSRGEAKYKNTDEQSGYSIGTNEYPAGLRQKADMQHYVAFYINVRDKSKYGKNGSAQLNKDYFVSEEEQRKLDAIKRSNFSQNDIARGGKFLKDNAGTIAGAALGYGLTKKMLGQKSTLTDLAKAVGTGAVAGVAAGVATQQLIDAFSSIPDFTTGKTSRLKDVITLHISERPVVKYGTNYTNKDMGILTGLLVQGSAGGSLKAAVTSNPEVQAALLTQLSKVPSLKAGGGVLSDMLELNNRQKLNPFREVLFESVDYRTFQFTYKFFPKDENETMKIQQIIKTFKHHMHPELKSNKMFYVYPSEFDIQYFYKDKVNPYLHNFARCALTNMTVEYGGEQFVTFGNGSPSELSMTLTFQELEQMTSEGIMNYGY
jgi:hypothetical protein